MVAKTNTASNLPCQLCQNACFLRQSLRLRPTKLTWDGTIRSVSVFKVIVQVVTLLWSSCWHKNAGEVT